MILYRKKLFFLRRLRENLMKLVLLPPPQVMRTQPNLIMRAMGMFMVKISHWRKVSRSKSIIFPIELRSVRALKAIFDDDYDDYVRKTQMAINSSHYIPVKVFSEDKKIDEIFKENE